ncbi:TetR/AcrR family transcriptional regulator [Variovorax sp. KK3]|uniref:acrylate utilization transcriptional regulator AcuR n=1 Tax=Variovorax sp. KK3 TaxID=1855728 RepID=UPI0009FA6D9C|nr:TetR/AcrR family transcriptional regulator [Variovorax sp. KK3]
MTTRKPKLAVPRTRSAAPAYSTTREVLIRCGMELLTEQGFSATGLDAVLKRATVPKGSFYHYFESKDAFGAAVMDAYDDYFKRKLDKWLLDETRAPLDRLADFIADASQGMRKHRYTRGCLVGNLSQELGALPSGFRERLDAILVGWQVRVATCLRAAQAQGSVSAELDIDQVAEFFWIAWEGAVLRARLVQSDRPLVTFIAAFLAGLGASPKAGAPRRPSR